MWFYVLGGALVKVSSVTSQLAGNKTARRVIEALIAGERDPRKPGKGQGNACLRGYCTRAANGAVRTDTFLGERLRRLSRRIGGARARCAVARSVLVIVWHLLSDPAARFTDLGADWHQRKTDRDKKIAGHLRQLRALGLEVTVAGAAA